MTDKPVPTQDHHTAGPEHKKDFAAQPQKPGNRSKTILWKRKAGMFGRNPVPTD